MDWEVGESADAPGGDSVVSTETEEAVTVVCATPAKDAGGNSDTVCVGGKRLFEVQSL